MLWGLPVYADCDFVEGDVREEAEEVDTVFYRGAITNPMGTFDVLGKR